MSESDYLRQVRAAPADIDMGFWKNPEGVAVPDDELRFLLIPDAVEAAAVSAVALQVHAYQLNTIDTPEHITRALIVTMGGMLPGALLHDHLVKGRQPGTALITFGTVGVSLYQSPGVRHPEPVVQQAASVDVTAHTVLLIDDLGDSGGTLVFLHDHLNTGGAAGVLSVVLYLKPSAKARGCANFHFGETDQDTWIVTPREQVETLVKRVPVWRARGASQTECHRRLVDLIGYPEAVVDQYLPMAFKRDYSVAY